jgi:GntR family transcriptional regulator, transcriptional repressor for pyruvate dehydrogenase complex
VIEAADQHTFGVRPRAPVKGRNDVNQDDRIELDITAGRSLPDAIVDAITNLVERDVYKPNERLPTESELAQRMGVARSSVRSALQRLESRKVVEVRRGLGWYVRPRPSADRITLTGMLAEHHYRISDLFELRIGLEELAVSLAAVRLTPAELDEITELNLEHELAGESTEALQRTDEQLHLAIVRASHNDLLVTNYLDVVGELSEWRRGIYHAPGVARRFAREHGRVIRYLGNGDPDGARAAMNSHLLRVYYEIPDIRETPLDSGGPRPGEPREWRER